MSFASQECFRPSLYARGQARPGAARTARTARPGARNGAQQTMQNNVRARPMHAWHHEGRGQPLLPTDETRTVNGG
ncbi:hypothetical protein OKW27_003533 [Paraburkholderia sp. 35.1]